MSPRASGRQCGAPRPASAGTATTPPESGTDAASASISRALPMMPSPSRSHCTIAPAMKVEPSSAYTTSSPSFQPTVVSSPFFDGTARAPVFMSMNAPVP
jgi:hypothetical protein